ncbi:dual oxidase 1-like [Ruditapes philippinarum]|uniref:dual oxidase 1-like n=1 Tax=Ruditapes philippinarum TaxID=129788 RepID=UPI00295B7305|nr:dual oxidase 1-like [Ruditapes philippinarum]
MHKLLLLEKMFLFGFIALSIITECTCVNFEGYGYDGWYNNLNNPDWGAAETPLQRKSKAAYSDAVYEPSGHSRPNPFDISKAVHQGKTGLPSYAGRTAMLVYFGQQIVEEIVDSQRPGCPIEYFNVPVPEGHPKFDPSNKGNVKMTFRRTRYDQRTGYSPNNPRQQLNEITPFLDGQVIYGPNKAWADALRSFKGGRLASTPSQFPVNNSARLPFANPPVARTHKLEPVSRFHAIGNPRGHENPFLLSFGILWFRWHNLIADQIAAENSSLTDEQIFNIARKRVIAQYQKIVFYDWLPVWLDTSVTPFDFKQKYPYMQATNETKVYNGYNPSVHPGIFQEFQTAAMRFGHTLVTPGLWRRTGTCNFLHSRDPESYRQYKALRLCNSYWNSRIFFRGRAKNTQRRPHPFPPDLTESLFGPLEFSKRDLAALNIQRGRDHGISDYNTVRESYGLKKIEKWEDINPSHNTNEIKRLKKLYTNGTGPENVDLFTGGMLETVPTGPGELFKTIIIEQFLRIRHGDRLWFENTEQSGLSQRELNDVWRTDLVDVITATTGIEHDIQRNVFLFTDADRFGCLEQPRQLNTEEDGLLEPCTPLETYDYFTGSEVSFAVTFVVAAACIPLTFLTMYLLAWHRRNSVFKSRQLQQPLQKTTSSNMNEFKALEWVDWDELDRYVFVVLDPKDGRLDVFNTKRLLLRYIDLAQAAKLQKGTIEIHLSSDKTENLLAIKLQEYDLVLKFYDTNERQRFVARLETFSTNKNFSLTQRHLLESYILRNVNTKKHRQEKLNKFFRKILSMFNEGEQDVEENFYGPVEDTGSEMTRIELTQAEFGEAFGMKPNSTFVKHMFLLVDTNQSGRVSFKEFLDIFILLSSDDTDSKTKLLFNMYDIKRQGYLTIDDLYQMIRSLLDLSESNVTDEQVSEFTSAVYKSAGLRPGSEVTFADFKKVFTSGNYAKTLKNATMELNAVNEGDDDQSAFLAVPSAGSKMMQRRCTLVRGYSVVSGQGTLSTDYGARKSSLVSGKYTTFARSPSQISRVKVFTDLKNENIPDIVVRILGYLETYRLHVFWLSLYCLVTVGVFVERSYYYAVERENGGLRRVANHGVTMSRGSASVIMFTYAGLLITMCKNLITGLRETFLHRFVPFDYFHALHKFIACISLVFTVLHVTAHCVNFYHVCTQPSTDLNCYFREYFRATHELASFHYWAFGTITGLTGICLVVLLIVLFVFALPLARRHLFHMFWKTHNLYIAIYILTFLHGSARLVQEPHFPYYIVGPAVLFIIDKLISISRATIELTVIKAELLPSDVTALTVIKPPGFEYQSGQWAQVACKTLGAREFHPFTMTSAPHEKYLKFHIRAVGPWTTNIRRIFDPSSRAGSGFSKLLLDGPFGEGHQDWYRYEVSVLIGGGIGVTPFASILKDIVHKSQMDVTIRCKKVYFLWVTRTQKQFEWVTDIIRDLEAVDHNKMVTTHIFVTEFKSKFDLRTSMLYICERHFQKIAGKSLFTGLEAVTHFGRPSFLQFLESLRYEHKKVKRLGIFSCGPRPMTLAVEQACLELNQYQYPTYYHHFENF